MKKVIIVMLIILSVLIFASCSAESKVEDVNPYVGTWIHVFDDDKTLVLNADGTGEFYNQKISSWVQVGSEIKIKVEAMYATNDVDFEILDFGGEIVLSETPNGYNDKYLLIKSDKYNDTAINNVKQTMIDQSEEWNYTVYTNTRLSNEAKAKLEYDDKLVRWTAKVTDINDGYCTLYIDTYNGLPYNPVMVYLSREECAKLNNLDTVTVVGFIDVEGIYTELTAAFVVENHG